jgi:hypothetical protein
MPNEHDPLLAAMAQATDDIPQGAMLDATADGTPTENYAPPEMPQPDAPEPTAEPKPQFIPKEAYEATAKTFVEVFSRAQEMLFGWLYKKKFVKPQDYSDLEALEQACIDRKPLHESEVLKEFTQERPSITAALRRVKKYDEYTKELVLSENEQRAIAEPLAECLEKWKVSPVTPEGKLAIAVGMIMMSRALPFLPVVGEKNVNHEPKDTTTNATA